MSSTSVSIRRVSYFHSAELRFSRNLRRRCRFIAFVLRSVAKASAIRYTVSVCIKNKSPRIADMKEKLKIRLSEAIAQCTTLNSSEVLNLLEKPKNRSFGDLAFPCFSLAKVWGASPPACAARLKEELKLPEGFSECVQVGPFLNFRFNRPSFIREVINDSLSGNLGEPVKAKVIVEYSSPNIAKPFHVGHLRATLIGNCLDRVYRELGWDTVSINHLGDWGTQFGFVWAGRTLWGLPENPDVTALVGLYRKATELRERQDKGELSEEEKSLPDVNQMARNYFIDLEKGEAYAVEFWKQCVAVSLDYLKKTYQRLNVSFDHYIGESFYSDKLDALRKTLEEAELLVDSEGALGVDLGEALGFARVYTADGRSLYLTRDLATAEYRAERFNFDRAIYVVGAPQTLHFQQLVGILKALGRDYASAIEHVAFGHVLGMKTRGAGKFIELNEFLDEAYERALEAYRTQVSKRPEGLNEQEVARGVALAAIIFSTLHRTNIKDVHFSWDTALEFQGDSGPYLLYAYARLNGIRQKATEAGIEPGETFNAEKLSEESAYELVSVLAEFSSTLKQLTELNEPSVLTNYTLELAKALSRAYLDLKVLGAEDKETAVARLTLLEATRRTLETAINLLGISPLERM